MRLISAEKSVLPVASRGGAGEGGEDGEKG